MVFNPNPSEIPKSGKSEVQRVFLRCLWLPWRLRARRVRVSVRLWVTKERLEAYEWFRKIHGVGTGWREPTGLGGRDKDVARAGGGRHGQRKVVTNFSRMLKVSNGSFSTVTGTWTLLATLVSPSARQG